MLTFGDVYNSFLLEHYGDRFLSYSVVLNVLMIVILFALSSMASFSRVNDG